MVLFVLRGLWFLRCQGFVGHFFVSGLTRHDHEESTASGRDTRELYLEPLGLTVTQGPGVIRKTLSMLVNGCAGISPEMAVRLSQAFGRSPESWL